MYDKFASGELNYDRILTARTLPITALYIASKLEEVHPLYASMAEQITKSTVPVNDLLACEGVCCVCAFGTLRSRNRLISN